MNNNHGSMSKEFKVVAIYGSSRKRGDIARRR